MFFMDYRHENARRSLRLKLAEYMQKEQPDLRVVFNRGYSDDVIGPDFLARTGSRFLAKPYTYAELTQIIRECLDQPAVPQASG